MATIRYVPTSPEQDPPERKVPDELSPSPTERGVEWVDEEGARHVVPWHVILEFIGPPGSSEPFMVTPSVEKL